MNNVKYLQQKADYLIAQANTMGCVVTIETVPAHPPVMGSYTMVASVRPRLERHIAKPLSIDAMCDAAMVRVNKWIERECFIHSGGIFESHWTALMATNMRHKSYLPSERSLHDMLNAIWRINEGVRGESYVASIFKAMPRADRYDDSESIFPGTSELDRAGSRVNLRKIQ